MKRAAREFAENEFPEVGRDIDINEEFPFDIWKKACGLGLVGCFIPEEYGGVGYGITEHCCIAEEFWRVDPGCGQCMNSAVIGAEVIEMFGNEEQKQAYLSPLVTGEMIMGIAITEADAGSDVLSASTTAIKNNEEYVISGNKIFITNGDIANFLVVFCKTNPEKERPAQQYSMLIVETDRSGYESNKLKDKLGIRASNTSEIRFNDVRVPLKNLVGTEGEGFPCLMNFFNRSRIMVAASAVGLAQGAMERAIRHIKARKQFGTHLSEFQANRFKIAKMGTMIEASRNLVYKAACKTDQGILDPGLVAMAKWFSAWVAVRSADEALQMHGGYGYLGEYDISRFYRDAKILEIYEGSKEVEKEIVARSLLSKQF
ncbi:MAG: acyl-CoA/acyl-ACP dehydrogenase [Syntrophaceae bacterium]|nr:acyl-CoA/acyl-ACP dehydrogenase [Syntrophaceae bacterium]